MRLLSQCCVFVFCFVCATVSQGQSIFQSVFRTPTYHTLEKIGYSSPTTMYAIGDGSAFVRTTNAGTSFDVIPVSPNNEFLHGVDFTSATQGVVCGDNGLVAFTTNGGTTWTTKHVPLNRTLLHVRYNFSSGKGFVVDDSASIFFTGDAGQTWQLTHNFNIDTAAIQKDSIVASPRLTGTTFLAITTFGAGWRTTDNGLHWDSLAPTLVYIPSAVYFVDSTHGWVLNSTVTSWTTDGGITWQGNFSGFGLTIIAGMYFKDTKKGWALTHKVAGGGVISDLYLTTDAGVHWRFRKSIGNGVVALQDFRIDASDTLGWAVGNVGEIRRAKGSDTTWSGLTSGATGSTAASSFFDDDNGVVATYTDIPSAGGYNFYTMNGGATWSHGSRVGENAFPTMQMTGQGSATALTNERTGVYTANAGAQWSGTAMPGLSSSPYTRIFQVSSTVLFACGQQGVVSFSSDAGHTWTSRNLPGSSPNLTGLWFADNSNGFVCGINGKLFKTNNGGTSWTPVELPEVENATLTDIAFSSLTSGWITTDSAGTVLHTNNGGSTWSKVYIGASGSLTRVVFATSTLGWIGGSNGQLYMTRDDGAVWKPLSTGTSNPITSISYTPRNNPHTLWLSGGSGMVLKGDLTQVSVAEPVSARPGAFAFGATYPNPVSSLGGSASVAFSFVVPATAQLDVMNMLGQRVRTITHGAYVPGSYIGVWDARDDHGAAVSPGVYFFALTSGGARTTKSIIVTH